MGENLLTSIVAVATAIIGVAIIAVLVSKNSNTAGVLSAGGSAFSSIVGAAVNPGGSFSSSGIGNIGIPNLGSLQ